MDQRLTHRFIASGLAVLITFTLSSGCKQRFRQSGLRTTSDRLQESLVTIRGTVEVPAGPGFHVTNHLMNLVGFHLDHPDQALPPSEFDSYEALAKQYETDPKAGRPIIAADGSIDQTALKYWIATQVKYTKKQFYSRGLSLTLDHIIDDSIQVDRSREDTIKVNFKGVFRALKQVTAASSATDFASGKGIQTGERITVPADPASYFYREFASDFSRKWEDFSFDLSGVGNENYKEVMRDMQTVAKKWYFREHDKTVQHKCFDFEYETVLSPFYLFYFFDPSKPGCSQQLWTSWEVEAVTSRPMDTGKYPEYHLLFAGEKPVDVFYFFGAGVSATREFNDLIPMLNERGFQGSFAKKPDGSPDLSKALVFSRKVATSSGREILLRLKYVDEENNPSARDEFRAALGYADVIYYGGHAGLGAKIDPALADPNAYPPGKYQILFLDGCSTYRYGMAEVLSAKALRDFDNQMSYVDVIASYSIVSGWRQKDVILDAILKAAALADAPAGSWQPDDQAQLSWLGIIKGMHKALDDQLARGWGVTGDYLVAGEENNDFMPGSTVTSPSFQGQGGTDTQRHARLEEFFRNPSSPQEIRAKALKTLLESDYAQSEGLESFIEKARKRCRDFGRPERGVTVLEELFWPETCQIRSISFDRSNTIQYRGKNYSGGARIQELRYQSALRANGIAELDSISRKRLLQSLRRDHDVLGFFANGQVEFGSPEFDFSTGKYPLTIQDGGNFVFWYENGQVAEASLARPVREKGIDCLPGRLVGFAINGALKSCATLRRMDFGPAIGQRQVEQIADFDEFPVRLFGTIWADSPMIEGVSAENQPFRLEIKPGAWLDVDVSEGPQGGRLRSVTYYAQGMQVLILPSGYVVEAMQSERSADGRGIDLKLAAPLRYGGRDYAPLDTIRIQLN